MAENHQHPDSAVGFLQSLDYDDLCDMVDADISANDTNTPEFTSLIDTARGDFSELTSFAMSLAMRWPDYESWPKEQQETVWITAVVLVGALGRAAQLSDMPVIKTEEDTA